MIIPVKIFGRDYSNIKFDLLDKDYLNSRREREGVWLPDDIEWIENIDEGNKQRKREYLARIITESFLMYIEGSKEYKGLVSFGQTGESGRKQKVQKVHFYGQFSEDKDWKYGGVVGVLRNKEFGGEDGKYIRINGFGRVWDTSLDRDGEYEEGNKDQQSLQDSQAILQDGISAEFLDEIKRHTYDITLQIGSRFDTTNTFFLPTMLAADDIEEIKEEIEHVPTSDDDIMEFLLLYLFKVQLQDAYKNGLYRTYTRFEKNDSKLKGAIDIARHIKLNMGMDNGKIAYSYREFTADNSINHLILFAYAYAKKRYPNLFSALLDRNETDGKMGVKKIVAEMNYAAPSFVNADLERTINKSRNRISHPYYYPYEKLRKTCVMLLRHMGVSMFDGKDDDVQGILFYLPDLWEDYLVHSFTKNNIAVTAQRRFDVMKSHETYPDLVFFGTDGEEGKAHTVLDCKFKPKWGDYFNNRNCDLADYTKCVRDMTTVGAHATGVIFPMKPSKDTEEDNLNSEKHIMHTLGANGKNEYERFYSFPIIIPDVLKTQSYGEWKQSFDREMKEGIDRISQYLHKEEERQVEAEDVVGSIRDIGNYLSKQSSAEAKEVFDKLEKLEKFMKKRLG